MNSRQEIPLSIKQNLMLQAATIVTPLATVAVIESVAGASLLSTPVVSGAALICALVLLFLGLFFPSGPRGLQSADLREWLAPRGPVAMMALVILLSVGLTLLFFFT